MTTPYALLSVLLMALVVSCTEPSVQLPEEPSLWSQTPDYDFGDRVSALDTRAWTTLWDSAEANFQELKLYRRVLPAKADWQILKDYYTEQLKPSDGWQEAAEFTHEGAGIARSFARRRGKQLLIIVSLKTRYQENGQLPVNMITNLKP